MRLRIILTALLLGGSMMGVTRLAHADKLDQVVKLAMQANDEAARSQDKVDALHEKTQDLLSDYRTVQRRIDSLTVYNDQLADLIESQEQEMVDLQRQIDDATVVAREITPMMLRMVDTLEQFVKLDVPFLREERAARIARLREIMDRADVSESEKFRQILEAYQVENEYGRTIEAYQGTREGEERTVNFLRVGRVVLAYQTLDGKEIGIWDQKAREWQELPNSYKGEIERGLRIARKQAAPDLMRLPVPAPEDVQ